MKHCNFFQAGQKQSCLKVGNCFLTISHPKALALSIPNSTTETRVFDEVNSKERERK